MYSFDDIHPGHGPLRGTPVAARDPAARSKASSREGKSSTSREATSPLSPYLRHEPRPLTAAQAQALDTLTRARLACAAALDDPARSPAARVAAENAVIAAWDACINLACDGYAPPRTGRAGAEGGL